MFIGLLWVQGSWVQGSRCGVQGSSSGFRVQSSAFWLEAGQLEAGSCPEQTVPDYRLPDDEAFREGNAGERAELGVAAFDELVEGWTGEAGVHGVGRRSGELAPVARQ